MGRVRLHLKAVHHPGIDALKQGENLIGQGHDVRAIGETSATEAKGAQLSVVLFENIKDQTNDLLPLAPLIKRGSTPGRNASFGVHGRNA